MSIFNKAAVIGPHGAGVNLIATKNKVCFIEFINNADINICYMRLAKLLNIEYFGNTSYPQRRCKYNTRFNSNVE